MKKTLFIIPFVLILLLAGCGKEAAPQSAAGEPQAAAAAGPADNAKAAETPAADNAKTAETPAAGSTKAAETPAADNAKAAETPAADNAKAAETPAADSTKAVETPAADSKDAETPEPAVGDGSATAGKPYYVRDLMTAFDWCGRPVLETGIHRIYWGSYDIAIAGKLFGGEAEGTADFVIPKTDDLIIDSIHLYVYNDDLPAEDCIKRLYDIYGGPVEQGEEPYAEVNGGSVWWGKYDTGIGELTLSVESGNNRYQLTYRLKEGQTPPDNYDQKGDFNISNPKRVWLSWDADGDGTEEELYFEYVDQGDEAPSGIEITMYTGDGELNTWMDNAYGLNRIFAKEDADGPYLQVFYDAGDYYAHDTEAECTLRLADGEIVLGTAAPEETGIDYKVLVNKLNPLPDDWEDRLETVRFTNSVGDDVEVETKAYDAYLLLKEDLEKEGIFVDLDSARRSVAEQQKIMDDFTREYGQDYALKTVARPGYSEHHTGLALDLYLIVDGKDIVENEDLMQYPEIWEKIHEKLAGYGFILRYLKDREHITGYGYEPWHIRYIDDTDAAAEIMDEGITFEGYLGTVNETDVVIDYGKSELFTKEELEEAAIQIKCRFASWKDCELHRLTYAGDEESTEENIAWLNSLSEGVKYTKAAEFLAEFRSAPEGYEDLEPDQDYKDYPFWLGVEEDGSWDIACFGEAAPAQT